MTEQYNWNDDSTLIQNFKELGTLILQNPTQNRKTQLKLGYQVLTQKLNKISSINWKLVNNTARLDRYVTLKLIESEFDDLPIAPPTYITKHIKSTIYVMQSMISAREINFAKEKLSEIKKNERNKHYESEIARIKSRLNDDTPLGTAERLKIDIALKELKNHFGTFNDHGEELIKIEYELNLLPATQSTKQCLALAQSPVNQSTLLELAKMQSSERTQLDTRNGFATSIAALKNTLNPIGEVSKLDTLNQINKALPIFRRVKSSTVEINYIAHTTKMGMIKEFDGAYNFLLNDEKKAAKVAIKLAKLQKLSKIEVWGSDEFINYVSQLCNKEGIQVNKLSQKILKIVAKKLETENKNRGLLTPTVTLKPKTVGKCLSSLANNTSDFQLTRTNFELTIL